MWRRYYWVTILSCMIWSGLPGCGNPDNSGEPTPELRRLRIAEWEGVLARYRGKYVVIDTWATWCGPCVKEFPKLVKLHHKYRDRDVVVLGVSIDDPQYEPQAREFLRKQQADFPNFLIAYDDWVQRWQITAIPLVLVLDQEGKLLRRFDRGAPGSPFTYEDVDRFLSQLLQAKN